jgi:hypothetical protein
MKIIEVYGRLPVECREQKNLLLLPRIELRSSMAQLAAS